MNKYLNYGIFGSVISCLLMLFILGYRSILIGELFFTYKEYVLIYFPISIVIGFLVMFFIPLGVNIFSEVKQNCIK